LLRAWKRVNHQGRKLVIAGDGPEADALKALSLSLQLNNVEFAGFLDQGRQRTVWGQTAFSVIPSVWSEPFPLTFLESWSQGRTFIANHLGAMAEVVRNGQDGLLSKPFAEESLADLIQFLINTPDACTSMGHAGHQRILKEFQRSSWLEKINDVFQKVLPLS
ncbi:MAG: glycosyltransferase, partial [Verrucomicrobia bacterium]|nr:glycosyltransferase [Verrucomicrobiota bacterium]